MVLKRRYADNTLFIALFRIRWTVDKDFPTLPYTFTISVLSKSSYMNILDL